MEPTRPLPQPCAQPVASPWRGTTGGRPHQPPSSRQAHLVTISIIQRWSKLLVRFETEHSQSHSISGALKVADVTNPELSYLYMNQPKASAPVTMSIHRGTATLELKGTVLEGDYYTGRGRMTFGSIRLTKI